MFLDRLRGRRAAPASFELAGRRFSGLRLLEKQAGRIWSRAGRLSWAADMEGRAVKIVECFSEPQAQFIERISAHPVLGVHLPTFHLREGSLIVVDWVVGEELDWERLWRDGALLDRLAGLQCAFHANSFELPDAQCGFDYREFLVERAWRFKAILPLDAVLQRLDEIVHAPGGPALSRLSHPDVSAANLVLEEGSGRLLSIDNELITQNPYFSIDLLNTARTFVGHRKATALGRRYLEAYVRQGGELAPLVEHSEFFSALWYLRLIGTALLRGDFVWANRLAEESSQDQGPPVMATAKEIWGA